MIVSAVGIRPQQCGERLEEGIAVEGAVEGGPVGRQQRRPVDQPQRGLGPGAADRRVGHLVLVEVDRRRGVPDHPPEQGPASPARSSIEDASSRSGGPYRSTAAARSSASVTNPPLSRHFQNCPSCVTRWMS